MKKLLFLLLFISSICSGQVLFIGYQPTDNGISLRSDYYISKFGFYSSVSYGNWGLYRRYNIQHHFKFTTGILIPIPDYKETQFNVNVGINYHLFGSIKYADEFLNPKIFNPWSFELGLTTYMKRFALGIRMDILRWEPCIDIGIKF